MFDFLAYHLWRWLVPHGKCIAYCGIGKAQATGGATVVMNATIAGVRIYFLYPWWNMHSYLTLHYSMFMLL